MMYYPKGNWRPRRYGGMLLGFGCQRTTSYTSAPTLGHTYCAYTQRHQSHYLKNYMREFMGVIREEDRWRIEHSTRGTGGRTCRERPKNMQRSVINVRDSPRISTNRGEFLTLSPVLGRLLSGVLILSALSRKQQGTSDT